MNWQLIETAPKDGTTLILATNEGSFVGSWYECAFKEYRDEDGFYVGQQDAEEYWMSHETGDSTDPTHWMPLPPPPETK
jgi:hypothetical protein